VFGVSMGGAAANLALPRLREVDGLVLDSTFADVAHVAVRRLPLGPLTGTALALARAFAVPVTGRRVLDVVPCGGYPGHPRRRAGFRRLTAGWREAPRGH
jgi:hypothetical protein